MRWQELALVEHFPCINWLNLHNNPMTSVPSLRFFERWESEGNNRWGNLPGVTQLDSGRAEILTQAVYGEPDSRSLFVPTHSAIGVGRDGTGANHSLQNEDSQTPYTEAPGAVSGSVCFVVGLSSLSFFPLRSLSPWLPLIPMTKRQYDVVEREWTWN